MKWQSKLVFVLLFGTIVIASVKHPSMQKNENQGYWVDPATGLMWAGKDNGRDVRWYKAKRYCRNLRLGGYADWRLATIEELEGLYDGTARTPGLGAGRNGKEATTWHVKGNLFLTGRQWSSTQNIEKALGLSLDRVWFLDFSDEHKRKNDSPWLYANSATYHMRALCVRSAGK